MQTESLVMVEIGCGPNKNKGYIGVDRFALPGVDIVADVNEGLPFDDDSVDVIWACHSLEHMDDIVNVFQEIYRVCKHKSIIMVLAPYYFNSLNIANPYHIQIFNEDTTRFFSKLPINKNIPYMQYTCPHVPQWGVSQSDNSEYASEIQTLRMEFFYYEEYRLLPEDEKVRARQSLMNVCDQLYYIMAANKTEIPFTEEETNELLKQADALEPEVIKHLRKRDLYQNKNESVLTDISKPVLDRLTEVDGRLTAQIDQTNAQVGQANNKITETDGRFTAQISQLNHIGLDLKEKLQNIESYTSSRLTKIESALLTNAEQAQIRFERLDSRLGEIQDRHIAALERKMSDLQTVFEQKIDELERRRIVEHTSLAAITLDLLKGYEKSSILIDKLRLFRKNRNLYNPLRSLYTQFTDGMILKCSRFQMSSILTLSKTVPFNGYMEHFVEGYGTQINFFIIATLGSKLFTEVVTNGSIIKQEIIHVEREGPHQITTGDIAGKAHIRFKTLDNSSIVRVLEVVSRKYRLFAWKSMAAYID